MQVINFISSHFDFFEKNSDLYQCAEHKRYCVSLCIDASTKKTPAKLTRVKNRKFARDKKTAKNVFLWKRIMYQKTK